MGATVLVADRVFPRKSTSSPRGVLEHHESIELWHTYVATLTLRRNFQAFGPQRDPAPGPTEKTEIAG